MTNRRQMKSAFPYVQRLLEDEFIQEQLREAAGGLRAVYMRARSKRGQAAEEKACDSAEA